jgi:hypothetical protein
MARRIVHLETLIGKKVYDPAGKCAGRIEEVRAHQTADGHCVLDDFLLGRGALLTRLSVPNLAGLFVHWLGSYASREATHCVPWDQLDLSDVRRPWLKCPAEELEQV